MFFCNQVVVIVGWLQWCIPNAILELGSLQSCVEINRY